MLTWESNKKVKDLLLSRQFLVGITLFAIIARMFAILVVGDFELENEYAVYVPNLLNGRGFSFFSIDESGLVRDKFLENPQYVFPSAFKPPVYPMLLTGFGLAVGTNKFGMIAVETFQVILGVISCWLIFDIGRIKFDNVTASLAMFLASIYPLLILSTSQISDSALQVFLICLLYWLLFKFELNQYWKFMPLLVGIVLGVLVVARTEILLYLPFIFLWIKFTFKDWTRITLYLFSIVLMVTSPWVIRNYIQFGIITMNTSGGLNLWEGQNENAKGVPSWYTDPSAKLSEDALRKIAEILPGNDYEIQVDRIYSSEARSFIIDNPGQVLRLSIRKVFYYWISLYPGISFTYPDVTSPLYWFPWVALLPFFILGVFHNIKLFWRHALFYLSFFLSTLTVAMFFVLPRYIIFILPWVILFAASGLARYLEANILFKAIEENYLAK